MSAERSCVIQKGNWIPKSLPLLPGDAAVAGGAVGLAWEVCNQPDHGQKAGHMYMQDSGGQAIFQPHCYDGLAWS